MEGGAWVVRFRHSKVVPWELTLLTKPPRTNPEVSVPLATDVAAPSPTTPSLFGESAQPFGACEIVSFAEIASLAVRVALRTDAGGTQVHPSSWQGWGCLLHGSESSFEDSVTPEIQEWRHHQLFQESAIRNDGSIAPFELCCPDFRSVPEQRIVVMKLVNWREQDSGSCHWKTWYVQDWSNVVDQNKKA
jgi:hypothetical protein